MLGGPATATHLIRLSLLETAVWGIDRAGFDNSRHALWKIGAAMTRDHPRRNISKKGPNAAFISPSLADFVAEVDDDRCLGGRRELLEVVAGHPLHGATELCVLQE
jgi:hypothetical protein